MEIFLHQNSGSGFYNLLGFYMFCFRFRSWFCSLGKKIRKIRVIPYVEKLILAVMFFQIYSNVGVFVLLYPTTVIESFEVLKHNQNSSKLLVWTRWKIWNNSFYIVSWITSDDILAIFVYMVLSYEVRGREGEVRHLWLYKCVDDFLLFKLMK